MNDSLLMRRADARADRRHQFEAPFRGESCFSRASKSCRDSPSTYSITRNGIDALRDAVIRNRNDVLMTNRGGGERFLTKARNQLRVVSDQIGQNNFYRVESFQISVPRFINDAHSALSETAFEMIFSFQNRLAADRVHRRHSVFRTGIDIIGVAIFTKLTLSHKVFSVRSSRLKISLPRKVSQRNCRLFY